MTWSRREVLAGLGLGGGLVVAPPALAALPASPPRSSSLDALTALEPFRELAARPDDVAARAARLPRPTGFEVAGLVARPTTWSIDALVRRFGTTERRVRLRAVEGWSTEVTLTGLPLAALLAEAGPLPDGAYVRLVAHDRRPPGPDAALPWPYHEGLTLPEALDPRAWLAVAVDGRPLSVAEGAPARVVLPWKLAHKSCKALARVEVVAERPPSFWASVRPDELDWAGDVDPDRVHPRFRQDVELALPEGRLRRTERDAV